MFDDPWEIYSPEASDGGPDWPTVVVEIAMASVVLAAFMWWAT